MTGQLNSAHGISLRIATGVLISLLSTPIVSSGSLILEYQETLVAEPQLTRPSAITFSPNNLNICVTDEATSVLNVFGPSGFHQFKTDGISQIFSPRDACIDAQGNFVFTDRVEGRARTIRRLNFLGEPDVYEPAVPREDWVPTHFILARDGHYITLDTSALLVKHNSETGEIMWQSQILDPDSEQADLFGRPAQAPDGRIYLANPRDKEILVLSPDGQLLTSFGEPGSRRGNMQFPVGVSFDPGGRVLVLDRMRHRILIFDSNHKFMTEFGRLGSGPGEMYHPMAIAASSEGRVLIAQGFEGRVHVFLLRDTAGTLTDPKPAHNNEGEKR
jgi:DNA-binding beta-propeller fold protein YncE